MQGLAAVAKAERAGGWSMQDDDSLDLNALLLSIRHGWWIVLLSALAVAGLGAVARVVIPPKYEAVAVVSVPSDLTNISVADLLRSDEVESQVVDALGLTPDEIDDLSISKSKDSASAYFVTARALSAERAIEIANTWAETGVSTIQAMAVQPRNERLQRAVEALGAADEALANFLQREELADVGWAELVLFTGVGTTQPSVIPVLPTQLTGMDVRARLALTNLVRERADALTEYEYAKAQVAELGNKLAQTGGVTVLSRALPPEEPEGLGLLSAIVLGGLAGFMLGVLLAVVASWYREPSQEGKASGDSAAARRYT